MPRLLLNLRNVSDDEADDVRDMLAANRIAFHETAPIGRDQVLAVMQAAMSGLDQAQ